MLTNNIVADFAKRTENIQQELESTRAELRDLRSEMKGHQIDKKAFAQALKFSQMAAQERADYIGTLMFYCECLGVKDFVRS
jgi:uncharacterized protein (UPF0335 family)